MIDRPHPIELNHDEVLGAIAAWVGHRVKVCVAVSQTDTTPTMAIVGLPGILRDPEPSSYGDMFYIDTGQPPSDAPFILVPENATGLMIAGAPGVELIVDGAPMIHIASEGLEDDDATS